MSLLRPEVVRDRVNTNLPRKAPSSFFLTFWPFSFPLGGGLHRNLSVQARIQMSPQILCPPSQLPLGQDSDLFFQLCQLLWSWMNKWAECGAGSRKNASVIKDPVTTSLVGSLNGDSAFTWDKLVRGWLHRRATAPSGLLTEAEQHRETVDPAALAQLRTKTVTEHTCVIHVSSKMARS